VADQKKGVKAVFLDRDGTIIEDKMYLADPRAVRILPGAAQGMRILREHGYLLIVVTNQSGVARGYFTTEDLDRVHQRISELLRKEGVGYDGLYYCPHFKDGVVEPYNVDCECRKPKPGLILTAAKDFGIDLEKSFLVGDSERDIEAGRRAGVRTILLAGQSDEKSKAIQADYHAADLLEAANWIIGQTTPLFVEEEKGRLCDRCGRTVPPEEVQKGLSLEKSGKYLCPDCVEKYRRMREAPADERNLLEQILAEMKRFVQYQTYKEFSIWNILGGIIQVGVFFSLFLWYIADADIKKLNLLLLAVVLQTMALSFFILGKR